MSPSFERRLHADDDRLLADIEMAEAADQPHAVHLPGSFLEAADQQHVADNIAAAPSAETPGSANLTGSALRLTAIWLPPGLSAEAWCQTPRFATSGTMLGSKRSPRPELRREAAPSSANAAAGSA